MIVLRRKLWVRGIEKKYQEIDVLYMADYEALYELVFEQKSQGSEGIGHSHI